MATITSRGPFQWMARVRRKGFPPQTKTFELRIDAEKWARKIERDMDSGSWRDNSSAATTSLREALERYQREITPNKRGAVTESIRIEAWKRHRLAKTSLASLRGADLAAYRDQRITQGIAASTVVKELAIISHLFTIARTEWGHEGLSNPLEEVRKPKIDNARSRSFLPGEQDRLLAALDCQKGQTRAKNGTFLVSSGNIWLRPFVELAIATAMRRGELLSLTWNCIDLNAQVAHLSDTKNGTSRDVPLSSEAIRVLRSLPSSICGQVFPTTENAIKLAFRRAVTRGRRKYLADCKEHGITPTPEVLVDLHMHDMRHIATTKLAEKLPNVMDLAAVTGHKDLRMLKRYYHPKAADLAKKLG